MDLDGLVAEVDGQLRARKRPEMVFRWLLPRAARASRVTLRQACKPLSAEQQAAIEAARRG
jgi:hypothetical protein